MRQNMKKGGFRSDGKFNSVINAGVLGYVLRRQGRLETALETQKDELAFLKGLVEKLISPRGA